MSNPEFKTYPVVAPTYSENAHIEVTIDELHKRVFQSGEIVQIGDADDTHGKAYLEAFKREVNYVVVDADTEKNEYTIFPLSDYPAEVYSETVALPSAKFPTHEGKIATLPNHYLKYSTPQKHEAYFTIDEVKQFVEEAHQIGQTSSLNNEPQAVMQNERYLSFSEKNKISLHLSNDIELDTDVMRAYHAGYEGRTLEEEIEKGAFYYYGEGNLTDNPERTEESNEKFVASLLEKGEENESK